MITKISAGGIIVNEYNEIAVAFTDTLSWQFPKGGVENTDSDFLSAALRQSKKKLVSLI